MSKKARTTRFFTGLIIVLAFLIIAFSTANHFIPTWGTTLAERSQVLPGDSAITSPVMTWKHAATINAAPEQVWPWLIQMGDTRGGFYSYMVIEKAFNGLSGFPVGTSYNNANTIHSEWQNPEIGQGMILDTLVLREYEPNRYLWAGPGPDAHETGLFWVWYITPTAEGRTRLQVHTYIQIPGAEPNPAVSSVLNLLTYMMGRKMMYGIQLRAEGGSEAPWVQAFELILGFTALAIGLIAARRFVIRPSWKLPLAIGLASVTAIFIMIYLQPAIWLSLLIVLSLIGGLVWNSKTSEPDFAVQTSLKTAVP